MRPQQYSRPVLTVVGSGWRQQRVASQVPQSFADDRPLPDDVFGFFDRIAAAAKVVGANPNPCVEWPRVVDVVLKLLFGRKPEAALHGR